MDTQEMLTVIRRHTLEAIIHALRVAVNYRKVQKQLKKMLYIKRLPWPDQLFTTERTMKSSQLPLQAFQWASWNIVHFYCLHNKIKSLLEEPTSLEEIYSSTIFGDKPIRKNRSESKLASKSTSYIFTLFFNWSDMHHFETRWTHKTLVNAEIYVKIQTHFFRKNFGQNLVEKQKNFRLKVKCSLRFIFDRLTNTAFIKAQTVPKLKHISKFLPGKTIARYSQRVFGSGKPKWRSKNSILKTLSTQAFLIFVLLPD